MDAIVLLLSILPFIVDGAPKSAYKVKVESCTVFQTLFTSNSLFMRHMKISAGSKFAMAMRKEAQDFLNGYSKNGWGPQALLDIPESMETLLKNTGLESGNDISKIRDTLKQVGTTLALFDYMIRVPSKTVSMCKSEIHAIVENLQNRASRATTEGLQMSTLVEKIYRDSINVVPDYKGRLASQIGKALAFEALQVCFVNDNISEFKSHCATASAYHKGVERRKRNALFLLRRGGRRRGPSRGQPKRRRRPVPQRRRKMPRTQRTRNRNTQKRKSTKKAPQRRRHRPRHTPKPKPKPRRKPKQKKTTTTTEATTTTTKARTEKRRSFTKRKTTTETPLIHRYVHVKHFHGTTTKKHRTTTENVTDSTTPTTTTTTAQTTTTQTTTPPTTATTTTPTNDTTTTTTTTTTPTTDTTTTTPTTTPTTDTTTTTTTTTTPTNDTTTTTTTTTTPTTDTTTTTPTTTPTTDTTTTTTTTTPTTDTTTTTTPTTTPKTTTPTTTTSTEPTIPEEPLIDEGLEASQISNYKFLPWFKMAPPPTTPLPTSTLSTKLPWFKMAPPATSQQTSPFSTIPPWFKAWPAATSPAPTMAVTTIIPWFKTGRPATIPRPTKRLPMPNLPWMKFAPSPTSPMPTSPMTTYLPWYILAGEVTTQATTVITTTIRPKKWLPWFKLPYNRDLH